MLMSSLQQGVGDWGRGPGGHEAIEFVADIDNPPYGGREFGIRDLNGYILYFRSDG